MQLASSAPSLQPAHLQLCLHSHDDDHVDGGLVDGGLVGGLFNTEAAEINYF